MMGVKRERRAREMCVPITIENQYSVSLPTVPRGVFAPKEDSIRLMRMNARRYMIPILRADRQCHGQSPEDKHNRCH